MDPVGKAYYKHLWSKRKKKDWSYSFGFTPKKRREGAIRQQHCIRWRLRKEKKGHATYMYDVSNAFPSIAKDTLDEVIEEVCEEEDKGLMKQRHDRATMVIECQDKQEAVLKTGTGNLQGDTPAPCQFMYGYNSKVLEPWQEEKKQEYKGSAFVTKDKQTGKEVNASISAYADDVAKTEMCDRAWEVKKTEETLDNAMDRLLTPLKMAQNKSKKEILVSFDGTGCREEIQKVMEGKHKTVGKVKETVRYLGAMCHMKGTRKTDRTYRKKG